MEGAVPRGEPLQLELRDLLRVLGKWRLVIGLVAATAVGTTAVLSEFVLPKVYRATATVEVSGVSPTSSPNTGSAGSSNLQTVVDAVSTLPHPTMATYTWEATDPTVLAAAAEALRQKGYTLTAAALAQAVKAQAIEGTDLINISATSGSPAAAAAIANAVAQAFVADQQQRVHAQLDQAVVLLQQQATNIQQQLEQATKDLAQAEQAPGASGVADSELQADTDQLGTLLGQLRQNTVNLQAAQAGLAELQRQLDSTPAVLPAPPAQSPQVPNPVYQSLQQSLVGKQVAVAEAQATVEELQRQLAALPPGAASALAGSPLAQEYASLTSQLSQAELNLRSAQAGLTAVQDQLASTPPTVPAPAPSSGSGTSPSAGPQPNPLYQSIATALSTQKVTVAQDQAALQALEQQIQQLQSRVQTLASQTTAAKAQVDAVKTRIQDLTETYQTLVGKMTDAQIADALALGARAATVATDASVPTVPVAPHKKTNVALALLLGLVAGVGLALLLEQLDTTVKVPEDIERVAGWPTLASIPHGELGPR